MYFYKFRLNGVEYHDRLKRLKLFSLKSRRMINDEITLYKIIHNRIDTTLNQKLSYYNHGRITRRDQPIFYPPKYNSNIVQNEPLNRMQDRHNELFPDPDILNAEFSSFKNSVKNKMKLNA